MTAAVFAARYRCTRTPLYSPARCSDKEDDMNKCDWTDCVKVGLFDGVENTLLNAEGQKNVGKEFRRFLYLCPEHFKLAIGKPDKENPPRSA